MSSILHINELPNEMLVAIMERIPAYERQKLSKVCVRWCSIVDEAIGIHKFLGSRSDLWLNENDCFEAATSLPQFGIEHLILSDFQDHPEAVPTPPYKYLHTVKEIWVDGFIYTPTLLKLIDPLTNLRSLTIHLSALNYFLLYEQQFKLCIPTLETFTISQTGIDATEFSEFYDRETIATNVLHILVTCDFTRSLKAACLHLPYVLAPIETNMISAVLGFINVHKKTMRKLLVSFEYSVTLFAVRIYHPVIEESKLIEDLQHGLKLKKFIVHCAKKNRNGMKCFGDLIDMQQGTLEKVHFTTGFMNFPVSVVEKNWNCLKTLELSVKRGYDKETNGAKGFPTSSVAASIVPTKIDLACLAKCTSLKTLTLVGQRKINGIFGIGAIPAGREVEAEDPCNFSTSIEPDLINLDQLPKSLQSIRIFNLFITSVDAKSILTKLPAMKLVNLHWIGTKAQLGITLETFGVLFNTRKIQYLSVIAGFNLDSLKHKNIVDTSSCASGDTILAGLLLQNIESNGFSVFLEKNEEEGQEAYYNISKVCENHSAEVEKLKIQLDQEVNVDFAIENDELFEGDEVNNAPAPGPEAGDADPNGENGNDFEDEFDMDEEESDQSDDDEFEEISSSEDEGVFEDEEVLAIADVDELD